MQSNTKLYLDGIKTYFEQYLNTEDSSGRRETDGFLYAARDSLDSTQLATMRHAVTFLRNSYTALNDVLVKNWEIITTPRDDGGNMPLLF